MPNIGDIKRARELGQKGTGLLIFEPCPECLTPRWHRKEKQLSSRLCPECGRKKSGLSGIDNSREWKRASELGKTLKHNLVFYKDSCPDCGVELWHRRKDIGKRVCNECHKKLSVRFGKDHGMWNGGRHLRKDGYVEVSLPPNSPYFPMVSKGGRVLEHRLVMAQHLGRCLEPWEIVHHKGTQYPTGSKEDRGDNRIENFELLPKQAIHLTYIQAGNEIKKLKEQVSELETQVHLLKWQIQRLQHGNPELNSDEKSDKCAETMGFASPIWEMVR